MATKAGSYTTQGCYQGTSWGGYTGGVLYAGKRGDYWVAIIKIKTPVFVGRGTKVQINLGLLGGQRAGSSTSSVTLRYALRTNDAAVNDSGYKDTSALPATDSYRLASGTKTITGLTASVDYYGLVVTAAVQPSATYYLYIWDYNGGSLQIAGSGQSVSVTYTPGVVRVDDGTVFGQRVAKLDDGSALAQRIPKLDDGSAWSTTR